ncbi:DUF3857 domain-containing protein [bacterium]|nr:DUF3857 domain-containing protein [bacterium]
MRMILKTLFIILVLVNICAADIIYLNSGEEYDGRLLSIENGIIEFELFSGELLDLNKDDVNKIQIEETPETASIKDLNDTLIFNLWKRSRDEEIESDIPYINLYEEVEYTINPVDFTWYKRTRKVQKILNDVGIGISNKVFYFLSNDENVKLNFARVIDEEGMVEYIRESAIKDEAINYDIPEYDNLHRKKIALRGTGIGSVIDYEIVHYYPRISLTSPFFVHEYFRENEPLKKKVVKVRLPSGWEFKYSVRNWEYDSPYFYIDTAKVTVYIDDIDYSDNLKPDQPIRTVKVKRDGIEKRNRKSSEGLIEYDIYNLVVVNQDRIEDEPFIPPKLYFCPSVIGGFDGGKGFGEYYKSILDSIIYTNDIKDLLNVILKNKADTLLEIYNYVIKEIKFKDVNIPDYSYTPKSLSQIFKNKSGNYLGKPFFLYGLYKYLDIPVELVFIQSRNTPVDMVYRNPLIGPSGDQVTSIDGRIGWFYLTLRQFSEVILRIRTEESIIYLAPFEDRIPFGVIPQEYQQVGGLRINEYGREPILIPGSPVEEEGEKRTLKAILDIEGNLRINETLELSGTDAIQFRRYKDLNDEEIYNFVEEMVHEIHPNAIVENFAFPILDDLKIPVYFNFNYRIDNYALKAGDDYMLLDLPGVNYSAYEVGREGKSYQFFIKKFGQYKKSVQIVLPAGYEVYYKPDAIEYRSDLADYRAKIDVRRNPYIDEVSNERGELNIVIFEDTFELKRRQGTAEDYQKYRDCITKKAGLTGKSIVLIRE